MAEFLNLLAEYWRVIVIIFSAISLAITLIKLIGNSIAINQLQNNEIKYLRSDIDTLKAEEKDFKQKIEDELHQVFLAIKRIEKRQKIRDAICDERHLKDK